MLSVGLTGNVAAGKSTVLRHFASWGATVIDADKIVREVQRPGSPVLEAIAARFGPDVVQSDGHLDRDRLRAIVVADPGARHDLNTIVHPAVQERRTALVAEARARGDRIVVHDIPLLFEVLDPTEFDAIVLVDAPEAIRLRRLRHSRGLTKEDAERLIGAQMTAAAKRERSDFVIDNAGTPESLRAAAREVWEALLARVVSDP